VDGDSHNDIKRGYLKCWSSMAEADIVFPNPSDLAGVAVVSEKLYPISDGSLKRYWTLDQYGYFFKVLTSVGR
jgi:hypothetical protein